MNPAHEVNISASSGVRAYNVSESFHRVYATQRNNCAILESAVTDLADARARAARARLQPKLHPFTKLFTISNRPKNTRGQADEETRQPHKTARIYELGQPPRRQTSERRNSIRSPQRPLHERKISSGQLCTVEPITDANLLQTGDIVLCKVNGHQYLHLIKAIQAGRFQIGNNRGGVNGWISFNSIYGKCVQVEG